MVRTVDHLSFATLSELLVEAGLSAARVRGDALFEAVAAVAGIWDCTASLSEDRPALKRFVGQLAPAPVMALTGFPRAADQQHASECGVRAVLGKPLLVDDLIAELGELCEKYSAETRSHGLLEIA